MKDTGNGAMPNRQAFCYRYRDGPLPYYLFYPYYP